MQSQDKTKLFVVGRGGNGKSLTTRTIVGEDDQVLSTYGSIKVISNVNKDVVVADGTGVGEPLEDLLMYRVKIGDVIKQVDDVMIEYFLNTLTAIVLVLKIGCRFTLQEKKGLDIVKAIFGQDVIRQRGVVVLTYGDNFNIENKGTFQEWCREQEGDFKSLMEECNYRCVLFDNRDGSKRESQVKEFMEMVGKIKDSDPYLYNPDEAIREKLIHKYNELEEKQRLRTHKFSFREFIVRIWFCLSDNPMQVIVILVLLFVIIIITTFCSIYTSECLEPFYSLRNVLSTAGK